MLPAYSSVFDVMGNEHNRPRFDPAYNNNLCSRNNFLVRVRTPKPRVHYCDDAQNPKRNQQALVQHSGLNVVNEYAGHDDALTLISRKEFPSS